jgi:hypothetical protein
MDRIGEQKGVHAKQYYMIQLVEEATLILEGNVKIYYIIVAAKFIFVWFFVAVQKLLEKVDDACELCKSDSAQCVSCCDHEIRLCMNCSLKQKSCTQAGCKSWNNSFLHL